MLSFGCDKTAKLYISYIKLIVFIILFPSGCIFIKDVYFEYKWYRLTEQSFSGRTKEILPEYRYLYNDWNGNPFFLYNYGAELNHIKEYSKSIAVLHKCEKYFNDYDVQMLLADNYDNMDQFNEAERYYLLASDMCPNRFIPLHRIMKIHDKKGCMKEADSIARIIITKKIKIPSSVITRIKIDAEKRIEPETWKN
ncbi:MAG: hypothetical protein LBT43_19375 [Prevotella sp.]|jgi:tetratricopeptide (TPR) repeat protein|nr:hypothetical protein [Prevotella sp.]